MQAEPTYMRKTDSALALRFLPAALVVFRPVIRPATRRYPSPSLFPMRFDDQFSPRPPMQNRAGNALRSLDKPVSPGFGDAERVCSIVYRRKRAIDSDRVCH